MRHRRLTRLKPLQVRTDPRSRYMRHGMARILVGRGSQRAYFHGHFLGGFDLVLLVVPFLVGAVEFVVAQSVRPSFLPGHFAFDFDNVLEYVGERGEDEVAAIPTKERREGFIARFLLFGLIRFVAIVVVIITFASLAIIPAGSVRIRHLNLAPPHPSPVIGQCQTFPLADHLGRLGVIFASFGDLGNAYELTGGLAAAGSLSDLGHGDIDDWYSIVRVGDYFRL
mmetsp:Transcript_38186/g.80061  ORF Transcript_38186/g.80061 Transcript_38186/m.80061 type:complete len:225 (-) Transcript_38186:246-920(-)